MWRFERPASSSTLLKRGESMAVLPVSSTLDALFRACEHARNDMTPFFPLADLLREEGYSELADLVELHIEATRDWSGCDQFMYSCGETLQTVGRMAELGCRNCRPWAVIKLRSWAAFHACHVVGHQAYFRVRELVFDGCWFGQTLSDPDPV